MADRGGAASRLGALLRAAARLDRTQSDPVVSARNAVGVVAPLLLAAVFGAAGAGLPATIGALQTAFADRPGPYRLRLLRMLTTAVAAAVTSGLAVLLSDNAVLSVLLLLVIAFGAGLLLTGGPAATQVGIASVGASLVLGHLPQAPDHAPTVALLVLAGGAGQTVLAIAAWPLGRHRPERAVLATLYRELAALARAPAGTAAGPQAGTPLGDVRTTLYGLGHDHGPSVEAYRVLLDEAARIRRETIVLAALLERLAADDPVAAGLVRAALVSCGAVLAEIGAALDDGRAVQSTELEPARAQVRRAVARLEEHDGLTRRATSARLRALAGQLRAAIEITGTGASEGRRVESRDVEGGLRLRDPIAVVRANLTPDSAVLRHAVRVAVLVAGSDAVVRAAGFTHGYWVGLTIVVVLRPDFATTFQRASMRVLGTVVGLLAATEVLHYLPDGTGISIMLIAVLFFGVRLAGPGNVALTAAALSALVVVLLSFNGIAPRDTLVDRSVATVVGGALALVAVLLLPVWERELVPARLATLIGAYRDYLRVLADPDSSLAAREAARAASRLARTNAQASVDRARSEPVAGAAAVDLGEGVLANSHRVVHALLTIDSVRLSLRPTGTMPELEHLLQASAAALDATEQALRTGQPPRRTPALRPLQEKLHAVIATDPARAGGPETAGALADATDRLANGVDTLLAELRRHNDQAGSPERPQGRESLPPRT